MRTAALWCAGSTWAARWTRRSTRRSRASAAAAGYSMTSGRPSPSPTPGRAPTLPGAKSGRPARSLPHRPGYRPQRTADADDEEGPKNPPRYHLSSRRPGQSLSQGPASVDDAPLAQDLGIPLIRRAVEELPAALVAL